MAGTAAAQPRDRAAAGGTRRCHTGSSQQLQGLTPPTQHVPVGPPTPALSQHPKFPTEPGMRKSPSGSVSSRMEKLRYGTGVQAQGQHPPRPPSPAQRGLPLVLAMENHAVLQWLYPGLQLLHLPSLPAHTSPTKALSHQPVFSSTAGLDSAHTAPSPGLKHGEHELLSLRDLSWTPNEPLDPSVVPFSVSFPIVSTVNAPSHPHHDCYLPCLFRQERLCPLCCSSL